MILVRIHTSYQKYIHIHGEEPEYLEVSNKAYEKLKKELNRNTVEKLFLKEGGVPVKVVEASEKLFRFMPQSNNSH